jgi:hypothetical protein
MARQPGRVFDATAQREYPPAGIRTGFAALKDDVEREVHRTAAIDECCQRVPVETIGKHLGERERKPEVPELFGTPHV